jgi:hypothetical protein
VRVAGTGQVQAAQDESPALRTMTVPLSPASMVTLPPPSMVSGLLMTTGPA